MIKTIFPNQMALMWVNSGVFAVLEPCDNPEAIIIDALRVMYPQVHQITVPKFLFDDLTEKCEFPVDVDGEEIIVELTWVIRHADKYANADKLESWHETHYEVVSYIEERETSSQTIKDIWESQGRGGIYELAKNLTDEFEMHNANRAWDGEFFDEIREFLEIKLP